jgi:hypothetical protein
MRTSFIVGPNKDEIDVEDVLHKDGPRVVLNIGTTKVYLTSREADSLGSALHAVSSNLHASMYD